jgi:hypothetical protein
VGVSTSVKNGEVGVAVPDESIDTVVYADVKGIEADGLACPCVADYNAKGGDV